jgi:hypothetical protein
MVASGTEIRGKPIAFHADHPFLYFLEDPSTGAVLFAGACPTRAEQRAPWSTAYWPCSTAPCPLFLRMANDCTRAACISCPNRASRKAFVCFTPSVLQRRFFSRPGRSALVAVFMRGETHAADGKFPRKKQTRGFLRVD